MYLYLYFLLTILFVYYLVRGHMILLKVTFVKLLNDNTISMSVTLVHLWHTKILVSQIVIVNYYIYFCHSCCTAEKVNVFVYGH